MYNGAFELKCVCVYNVVPTSSITYNGSMESPVPLYPTDCPPPYEAVMGQRAASQVSVFSSVCICLCVCVFACADFLFFFTP